MKTDSNGIAASLEYYGLSKNEAYIYLFLLRATEASAFVVARETGIPRTTAYATLEALKKQGFISQFKKNNIAHFTPESPNRLLTLLKRKEEIVNEIMPHIRSLAFRTIDSPIVKLYTGLDGIKAGLGDVLETLKATKYKQLLATSQPELIKYLPKYFPNWLKARESLGVFTKLILPHSAHDYLDSNALREVRYLPARFPFTCSVDIYANKIVFFSISDADPYCVIIESQAITEMFRQFFLFSWEMLGRQA